MAIKKLGPFTVLRVLGRGGMGTVYEATEEDRDEHVAVKALAPTFSFDEHFRTRFEAEIDALLALDHKNIVRLLAFGQDQGNLYFAMELIDGQSLYQEQKKGHVFHWQEIIEIGMQVCEGLRHAHERGIIHRDLKPGNLMIDNQRQIKIADFGIAKTFGKTSVTSEGNVLGTMDFMAPEQARGLATDARSDLFSLGAVLYSLLAGKPPFLKKEVDKTIEALLSVDPPPRLDTIAPDTPKPLADLIHRLLEKDPRRRIATAVATGRQLAHVLGQIQVGSLRSDTEVVGVKAEDFSIKNTSVKQSDQASEVIIKDSKTDENITVHLPGIKNPKKLISDSGSITKPDLSDSVENQPDFFNEVTPQQRQKKAELPISNPTSGSPWPLLFALVVVLVMIVGGVWFATRPPSKDELLTKILNHQNNPTKVRTEIKEFQEWYSEEPEIDFVNLMQEKAEIERYCNTLTERARSVSKRPLTATETMFVEYFENSRSNIHESLSSMKSLVVLMNTATTERSEADEKVFFMAKRVVIQWERAAQQDIASGTRQIQDGFRSAENSQSTQQAMDIYESIIGIYKGREWAADLVKEAQERLESLKQKPDESR